MSERRPPTCPCCAGHGVPLGALGRLHWSRCRDCGMTFARAGRSKRTPRAPSLFAGSDGGGQHWAVIASLVATCKLIDVDPYAYLSDVLTRIVARHPMSRIDDLLPFAYVKPKPLDRAAA